MAETWTDALGRTYRYEPYRARSICDQTFELEAETLLALSEASHALGSVPAVALTGAAAVLFRSESTSSSLIEGLGPGTLRILEAEVSVPWSHQMQRYVDGLRAYEEANRDAWLRFVSWATIEAVSWMRQLTERVDGLLVAMRSRVRTRGRSIAIRIIDDFPLHPIVDTQSVAARYDVTPQSAHKALVRLEAVGIVRERPFSRRRKGRPRRAFAAVELIDLLGEAATG